MRWLVLAVFAACGGEPDAPLSRTRVYAGTLGDQIQVFAMDPDSFALTAVGATQAGMSPSFLALDPEGDWLVATGEGADTVESFAIDDDGALAAIGQQPVGVQPAHVTLDSTGAWVLVSNFGAGTISVMPIDAGGTLEAAVEVAADDTVHQVVVHPNNELAFAPCLEANGVVIYTFDAATGGLEPASSAAAPAGAGPRHLALSRTGGFAWLMNQFASSVTTYRIARDGAMTEVGTVSALPAGFSGDNASAEIALHPSLNVLYASNRGHDSIAVFDVAGDGSLALRETVATGADPRHFAFVPGGMLVANEGGNTIGAYRIDAATGDLTAAGEVATIDRPAFVGVLELR